MDADGVGHTQLADVGAATGIKCQSQLSASSSIGILFLMATGLQRCSSVLASDLLSRKAEQVLVQRWKQVLADVYIVVRCDVVIVSRKVTICGFLLSDCHVSAMDGWEVGM